jgi:hypothetical protein
MTFELSKDGTAVDFKDFDSSVMITGCHQFAVTTETATVGCLVESRNGLDDLVGGGAVNLYLDVSRNFNISAKV